MKNTLKITIYSDPGHAWGKVARSELVALQLCGEISQFSYQRGEYVYLEEDSDLPLFIKRLEERNAGIKIDFIEKNTNKRSRIRSYDSFSSPLRTFISQHFIFQKVGF